MTRRPGDVERVQRLLATGMPVAEAARRAGIPRSTVQMWRRSGLDGVLAQRIAERIASACDPCLWIGAVPEEAYAYLLGLYLGDGCISEHARGVYALRINLDQRYPNIVGSCIAAMAEVLPNKVSKVRGRGCYELVSTSKHWPCLFPQHGKGPKHLRPIVLTPWQAEIALGHEPRAFLRGLVHSDGCRLMNCAIRKKDGQTVKVYRYPRYQFSNRSPQIRELFREACAAIGVVCKKSNEWNISVSTRQDVAILDRFIGPKV